uniref:Uncharacterized protein n=1 Tax=Arundo donax TaxID=35708 RepID=A0A0A8ZMG6_ARUDO
MWPFGFGIFPEPKNIFCCSFRFTFLSLICPNFFCSAHYYQ